MIFNFLIRKTKDEIHTITKDIPVGNMICGLQKQGQRPISVTLTYSELKWLLQSVNMPYTCSHVLHSLSRETI